MSVDVPEVMVFVPGKGQLHADAMTITFRTELSRQRNLCIKLEDTAMHYVRVAVLARGDIEQPKTAKREPAINVDGVKGVYCDKRRKVVFTHWQAEGSSAVQRVQKKPEAWEQPYINQTAQQLYEQVQNLTSAHVGLIAADADLQPEG